MAINCDELFKLLDGHTACQITPFGTRVMTHCMYPDSDNVYVYVARWGDDGFRVSDGQNAAKCALTYGRDQIAVEAGLKRASSRFSLATLDTELFATVPSKEWLPNVIMAVANGASFAANVAIEHANQALNRSLKERLGDKLRESVPTQYLAKNFEFRGESGKMWHVDYAITRGTFSLFKSVTSHPASIAATYTSLADLRKGAGRSLAVFDERPQAEDAALLRQVAELTSLSNVTKIAHSIVMHPPKNLPSEH